MPKPIKRIQKTISIEDAEQLKKEQENRMQKAPVAEFITEELKFRKLPVEEILEQARDIDPSRIAEEILKWLDIDVENFIDNSARLFEIPIDNLDVQADDKEWPDMVHTKKLQDLYRAVPDEEDIININGITNEEELSKAIQEFEANLTDEQREKINSYVDCRRKLDTITEEALSEMKKKTDLLAKLAERMAYYYEGSAIVKGEMLIQEMQGLIDVLSFVFDTFSMGVRLTESQGFNEEGKQVTKEYVIPEGFIVCIELSYKPKKKPVSLF